MNSPASSPLSAPVGTRATWRGMTFMIISTFCAAGMVAIVRYLSSSLHPFEVALFRIFFGLIALMPLLLRHGVGPLKTKRYGIHAIRGICSSLTVTLSFWALAIAPLAKVMAINFGAPLFATVIAIVVLGEMFRLRRAVALAVGFSGMILILRPGIADIELGVWIALLASIAWAGEMTVIKILVRTETSLQTTLYMTLTATPVIFLFALPVWQWPTLSELGWLAVIGALGSLAHLCFAQAFKESDMTAVLPLKYLQLVWVAGVGFIGFGEVPDIWTWMGAALIVAGAGYFALRER